MNVVAMKNGSLFESQSYITDAEKEKTEAIMKENAINLGIEITIQYMTDDELKNLG
jgi:hypothetical protein